MNVVVKHSLQDTMTLADAFVASGFFTDAKSQAQAIVKILAGQELGFGPMASMTGVYIVKGKVSLSANLMAAAVKYNVRYNYRVRELSDTAAEVEFFERAGDGWEAIGKSRFTMDDAKAANLLGNATWKQYPRNMLFARAMSNGVKWYTPDIFGGPIYTPDELGEIIDGETGEIIDVAEVRTFSDPGNSQPQYIPASDAQRKLFHALGGEIFGAEWDSKRGQVVSYATDGAKVSSADMSQGEMTNAIEALNKKKAQIAKRQAEEQAEAQADADSDANSAESLLEEAAAANSQSQYAAGA